MNNGKPSSLLPFQTPVPLVFAVFSNASLFPTTFSSSPDFLPVDGIVIGTNFYGRDLGNLTEPISIVIR